MQKKQSKQNILKKLKIFTSQYKGKQISYNFNSRQQQQFIFDFCEYPIKKSSSNKQIVSLYFYQKPQPLLSQNKSNVIISTTMDYTNTLILLFNLKIQQKRNEYVFNFLDISAIIRQNQQQRISLQKLNKRLSMVQPNLQIQSNNIDLLKQKIIPSYFEPIKTKNIDIWFVPRFMSSIEVQKDMIIRFYYPQLTQDTFEFNDAKITQLSVQYIIEQTALEKMYNNTILAKQNQSNLFHMCSEVRDSDNKNKEMQERKCYICMESDQDKSTVKHPNFLVDPCRCSGSMKFVHMKCLSFWINSKNISEAIICNHCNSHFPQYIQVPRIDSSEKLHIRYFRLIGNSNTPYIVIDDSQYQLFSNQQITLGTSEKCNYNKASSKKQKKAQIHYQSRMEKAYIKDLRTDYGTLVKKKIMSVVFKKNPEVETTCTVLVNNILFHFTIQQNQ